MTQEEKQHRVLQIPTISFPNLTTLNLSDIAGLLKWTIDYNVYKFYFATISHD